MGDTHPPVIRIRGAKEHNLRSVDVDIPRNRLVVITGVSGSGKSSLALDTIYAEGQRRYVESLSAYARQFLEQMQKPDVELIEGLAPTIAIEQRRASANPRSTVATTTEIYDYLRLLYARVGEPHCPGCGRPVHGQTAEEIVNRLLQLPQETKLQVLAVLVRGRKGEHRDVLSLVRREGYVRVRVDGVVRDAGGVGELDKNRKHEIEAVVDRLIVKEGIRSRLADSVELALRLGEGLMVASIQEPGAARARDELLSELYACPDCGISFEELAPRMFSFNSPYGACPTCEGLGTKMELDPDLIIPDKDLSLAGGAIEAWRRGGHRMNIYYGRVIRRFGRDFNADVDAPFKDLPRKTRRILMHGTTERDAAEYGAEFEGVIPNLERRFHRTDSDFVKERIHEYMSALPCPACGGARLRPESLGVRIAGRNIREVAALTVERALAFFEGLSLAGERAVIAAPVLKEVRERLSFLDEVGLGYITLDRSSGSLSGGEAQRIKLASQLGSKLSGVCYVLDEPTIGLHQRDNARLLGTLVKLRDLGNSVLVVEHDEEVIRSADWVIDLGPGAGREGGRIVAQGTPAEVERVGESLTGQFLSGRMQIHVPAKRRPLRKGRSVVLHGATGNNLKGVTVEFPTGVFVCVTGVSGSGKSTLVTETLHRALAKILHHARTKPQPYERLTGTSNVDKVIEIDQSPIGRTPRSNPATYTGVFDEIRKLFAKTPESRMRGYAPGRFSFNVKGGRCESCQGQGEIQIEMHFLPDVHVTCEACRGRRYNRETLEVKYKGKSVADVLDMNISEALKFFKNIPSVKQHLTTLQDVGLGYMRVGQSSTTMSGGESQRVKLAAELGRTSTGSTLYVLDEPTTGLHFADIQRLLDVLDRLVELGNTVVVIEHNMDVVKTADYIIDMGPEGGDAGGRIVATGSPEEVAQVRESYTGRYLRRVLARATARAAV
jgi:excinuclease ABC subunit A